MDNNIFRMERRAAVQAESVNGLRESRKIIDLFRKLFGCHYDGDRFAFIERSVAYGAVAHAAPEKLALSLHCAGCFHARCQNDRFPLIHGLSDGHGKRIAGINAVSSPLGKEDLLMFHLFRETCGKQFPVSDKSGKVAHIFGFRQFFAEGVRPEPQIIAF